MVRVRVVRKACVRVRVRKACVRVRKACEPFRAAHASLNHIDMPIERGDDHMQSQRTSTTAVLGLAVVYVRSVAIHCMMREEVELGIGIVLVYGVGIKWGRRNNSGSVKYKTRICVCGG